MTMSISVGQEDRTLCFLGVLNHDYVCFCLSKKQDTFSLLLSVILGMVRSDSVCQKNETL